MKAIEVLLTENIPVSGALVVPARLNQREAAHLERQFGGRPVVPLTADDLASGNVDAVREHVAGGGIVLFHPAPTAGWRGNLSDLPSSVMEALLAIGVPVVPVAVDRPAESCLTIENPGSLPEAVCCISAALEGPDLTVTNLLGALLEAHETAFSRRPILNGHLAHALLRGLKKHGGVRVVDGSDESTMTYAEVLAAAIPLSKLIRQETTKPRIGIVLPPGRAGLIANVAALLAGKVPVNLNYTAAKESVESAIRQAEIDRFLTIDLFVRKMQSFPWPPTRHLILIERVLPRLKNQAVKWGIIAKILPARVLAILLRVPSSGDGKEAALLFTSGSSGEPKGVVLSHRNLLANVNQFSSRLGLTPADKALACLPLFHSFGSTVTMWYPLIEGFGIVTYPTPLDPPKLAGLMEKYGVTILLSTPTFLRGYMRKVKREQLATLRFVVTGAEKLPASVAQSFKDLFGKDVLEGYGLTETSPATNLSLPALPPPDDGRALMPSHRPGAVGQCLPGVALRITDPISGGALPLNQSGMIWFKGANIFTGYLKQPRKTEEVLQLGWFRTGDIGRLDDDGFLYIEGRLSRFSKIGGEMVPHETIEEHIIKACNLEGESERKVAVVGIPDPDKGEALVLLSTVAGETIEQEIIQLRYALLDRGVPALWIPKKLMRVTEIPLLASGKLDIKKCEELAKQA